MYNPGAVSLALRDTRPRDIEQQVRRLQMGTEGHLAERLSELADAASGLIGSSQDCKYKLSWVVQNVLSEVGKAFQVPAIAERAGRSFLLLCRHRPEKKYEPIHTALVELKKAVKMTQRTLDRCFTSGAYVPQDVKSLERLDMAYSPLTLRDFGAPKIPFERNCLPWAKFWLQEARRCVTRGLVGDGEFLYPFSEDGVIPSTTSGLTSIGMDQEEGLFSGSPVPPADGFPYLFIARYAGICWLVRDLAEAFSHVGGSRTRDVAWIIGHQPRAEPQWPCPCSPSRALYRALGGFPPSDGGSLSLLLKLYLLFGGKGREVVREHLEMDGLQRSTAPVFAKGRWQQWDDTALLQYVADGLRQLAKAVRSQKKTDSTTASDTEKEPGFRGPEGPEGPPHKKPRKKRGHPEVSVKETARRQELLDAWEQAHEAGVSRRQFVQDWNEDLPDDKRRTVRDLEKAQDWIRQRRARGKST